MQYHYSLRPLFLLVVLYYDVLLYYDNAFVLYYHLAILVLLLLKAKLLPSVALRLLHGWGVQEVEQEEAGRGGTLNPDP